MNAKPKLQDTLEVFIEELENIKDQLNQSKEILPMIDDRVREMKECEVKVDTRELKYLHSGFRDDIVEKTNALDITLKTHLEKTKEILAQQRSDRTSFYMFSFLSFFIGIIAVFFAVNFYMKQTKIQERLKIKEEQVDTFKAFIYDTKQEKIFKKWYKKYKK